MSDWRLVRLQFGRSPVHFGELGIGIEETSERVRSDTLFSAWISAYARLFAVEELLKRFPRSNGDSTLTPPFRLSSTFVYRREGDRHCDYLPRLLKPPRRYPTTDDLEFSKTYKKLTFLPLEVWQRWYQGVGFTPDDRQELIAETKGRYRSGTPQSSGGLRQAGTFDYGKAFERDEVPRIAVDRTTRATNLYHTGFVRFQWEPIENGIRSLAGLYFLLHFPQSDPQLEQKLQAAIALLGEEGIGGERSSGAGRFEVEWSALPALWQSVVNFSQGDRYGLISLFWECPVTPTLIETAKYTLQERGGWISSEFGHQLRRKTIQMFAEGSVFPHSPTGLLADVTPENFRQQHRAYHNVYRSGISLSLPVHLAP